MDFESLSYQVRNITTPGAGWRLQVLPPDEDDFSQVAAITRRILAGANTLCREGVHGFGTAPLLSVDEEELLSDDPDGRDALHLYFLLQDLAASRRPAP